MRFHLSLCIGAGAAIAIAAGLQEPLAGRQPADVSLVPNHLRTHARAFLLATDDDSKEVLLDAIGDQPDALRFLIARLQSESSAKVRKLLVDSIAKHATAEALKALKAASSQDSDASVRALAGRWVTDYAVSGPSWSRDTVLRASTRGCPPPARFRLPSPANSRAAIIGDFGTVSEGPFDPQERVANVLKRIGPYQFGLTVGDNFYDNGLTKDSRRWTTDWETPYAGLETRFYATLGNHDWHEGVPGELEYQSASWSMPSCYYSFTASGVQFLAIDTEKMEQRQLDWIRDTLKQPQGDTPTWRVVYGHHPIYSGGFHGSSRWLRKRLLPILHEFNVDLYIAGHDHDLQYLRDDRIDLLVVGGGGKDLRSVDSVSGLSRLATSENGFAVLGISPHVLNFEFVLVSDDRTKRVEWSRGRTSRETVFHADPLDAVTTRSETEIAAEGTIPKSGIDADLDDPSCIVRNVDGDVIGGEATCRNACVDVPPGAQVKSVRTEWRQPGQSMWESTMAYARASRVELGPESNQVCAQFKNWSHDQDRKVRLAVSLVR